MNDFEFRLERDPQKWYEVSEALWRAATIVESAGRAARQREDDLRGQRTQIEDGLIDCSDEQGADIRSQSGRLIDQIKESQADGEMLRVASMLRAMSIEDLLKAFHCEGELERNPGEVEKCKPPPSIHKLHDLAARLGLQLHDRIQANLDRLTIMVQLGRYQVGQWNRGQVKTAIWASLPAEDEAVRTALQDEWKRMQQK